MHVLTDNIIRDMGKGPIEKIRREQSPRMMDRLERRMRRQEKKERERERVIDLEQLNVTRSEKEKEKEK